MEGSSKREDHILSFDEPFSVMKHRFWHLIGTTLLVVLSFPVNPGVAQSWAPDAAFAQIVTDQGVFAVTAVHAVDNRLFASVSLSDLTYRLFLSDDQGQTWQPATSDTNGGAYTVLANPSENIVFSYGTDLFGNRFLRKSEDNGGSWNVQTADFSALPASLVPIHLAGIEQTLILTSTSNATGIVRSTDGGATWALFDTFADNALNKSVDDLETMGDFFYLASSSNGLYRSHRDSTRWELVRPFGEAPDVINVYDILIDEPANRIYLSTTAGLSYSDDAGATWTELARETLGIGATGVPETLLRMGNRLVVVMADASDPRLFLVENLSTSTRITDGLTSWSNPTRFITLAATPETLIGTRFTQATTLWRFGAGGSTAVPDEPGLPGALQLTGTYPNPASVSSTLSFDLTAPAQVSLRLFNLLGQEVLSVLNTYLPAGAHSAVIPIDRLAPGVYTIRIATGAEAVSQSIIVAR